MTEINTSDEFQKKLHAFANGIFNFKNYGVRNMVKNSFPQYATQENLETIGRSRNLPRYQGEDINEYRLRVNDAYRKNLGLGSAPDIIRIMEGLGASTLGVQYRFNGFIQGNIGDGSTGLFNLLVKASAGGTDYNFDITGVTYDFSISNLRYDSPSANDIIFEIVQPSAVTLAQDKEIREALDPIIRASSKIFYVIKI